MTTSPPAPPAPPAAIAAMRRELGTVLATAARLDQAGLVDLIGELETLTRTASAAQAAMAARLDELLTQEQVEAGVKPDELGKGIGNVLAVARRESPHRGRRHLSLARVVPVELPHTWAAWQSGHIDEWSATVIARETACLPLEHRLAVDEHVAADPEALERLSTRQLIARLRTESERLDPAACVARRRQAESDRRVTLRPAPDCMTWLTALLPVKDGVAVFTTLTREADRARAAGLEKSRGQVMADTLVDTLLGATRDKPADPVALGVVMTDSALLAGADDQAHLDGFGPIPAELAREIVAGALSEEEVVSIRRLYTSPTTGELVAMDSRSRTFRGNLAQFIRLRDRTCRNPWCDAPVRHVDHVVDAADGGETTAHNGEGLCEACNYAKTAHKWRARPEPDGSVTTTLPTGHRISTRPPPIATIRWRPQVPPLLIDYVLTG